MDCIYCINGDMPILIGWDLEEIQLPCDKDGAWNHIVDGKHVPCKNPDALRIGFLNAIATNSDDLGRADDDGTRVVLVFARYKGERPNHISQAIDRAMMHDIRTKEKNEREKSKD